MKSIIERTSFFILIILTLTGCWNEIDDTNVVYTENTTTLQGYVLTEDGTKPMKNLKLNLDWTVKTELGGTHRNIKYFETDSTGHFKIDFYVTDLELEWEGGYNLKFIGDYPEYIQMFENELATIFLNKRDTVVDKVFFLPRKGFLKLTTSENQDSISWRIGYKYGDINDTTNSLMQVGFKTKISTNTYLYEIAGNQKNYIEIRNRRTHKILKTDSVFVTIKDTAIYNIKL